jgi:tRNA(fMet)-specific endonuclease VapC
VTEPLFLLDTNICVYVLKDASSKPALRLGECSPGSVAASAITLGELLVGTRQFGAAAVDAVRAMFDEIRLIPFEADSARAYASFPFRRGRFDRLIAAQALARNLVLVTNNVRDFADVPGLRIENWADA